MCIGAIEGREFTSEDIIRNGIKALSGRMDCGYAKGINAYNAWIEAIEDESNFSVGGNYTLLFEKMLCQNDAIACLSDGRNCASLYFGKLAEKDAGRCSDYKKISGLFRKCSGTIMEMQSLYNPDSGQDMDGMLKKLADKETRKKTCELIKAAQKADLEALEIMKSL